MAEEVDVKTLTNEELDIEVERISDDLEALLKEQHRRDEIKERELIGLKIKNFIKFIRGIDK